VGFAKAIYHFDILKRQPHSPGFFLYVISLRVIHFLTNLDDVKCIVALSIISTIAAGILFYLLVKSSLGSVEAFLLSLLLLTGPIVWFNAEISLSYPVGLLGSIAVALCAYRTKQGNLASYILPIVWGLLGGFRLDVCLMLTPLVLFSVGPWFYRSPKYLLLFLILFTSAVFFWLGPLVHFSGGLHAYLNIARTKFVAATPLASFMARNWQEGILLTFKGIAAITVLTLVNSLGVFPLLFAKGLGLIQRGKKPFQVSFLALWFLPGFILHALLTIGHSGHILAYLPAVLLLAITIPDYEKRNGLATRQINVFRSAVVIGIIAQSAFFLFAPQHDGMFSGRWTDDVLFRNTVLEPTRSRLQEFDSTTSDLVAEIRGKYPAETTFIIVPVGDDRPFSPPIRSMFAQAQYYLPAWELRVLYVVRVGASDRAAITSKNTYAMVKDGRFRFVSSSVVIVPRGIKRLVWFCNSQSQPYPFDSSWSRYSVRPGVEIVSADIEPDATSSLRWGSFEFISEKTEYQRQARGDD
jgi:hypothetical protein